MTIRSVDEFIAAVRQSFPFYRFGQTISGVNLYNTRGGQGSGHPGSSSTIAGGSTANGEVPTDTEAGVFGITAFQSGARGYLANVSYTNSSVANVRACLYDVLFRAGSYNFNANQTLTSQPSFSSRIPDGDYSCTELFVEGLSTGTGNLSVAIGYTDQDGNTGATTGTYATGGVTQALRWMPIPLAAGDSGLRKVESVVGSVATGGTFNVIVARRLWSGTVAIANGGQYDDAFALGFPEVFEDSHIVIAASGSSEGIIECSYRIVNG